VAITTLSTPPIVGVWNKFETLWASGTSTSATITIIDLNTIAVGNDLALDDISLVAVPPHLSVRAPNSNTAGGAFDVTVTALNALGQVANDYTGTVHFTGSDPHPGVLPSDYAFTATENGSH